MSLKRIFSLLTVALSVAVVGFAQDAKPETATPEKAEKRMMKGMKRDGVKRDGMKRGGRGHFGSRRGGMQGLRGIELSDAQKGQIKAIHESNKPDAAVMAEMKAIRDARRAGTELTQDQKDRVKVIRSQQRAKGDSVRQQIENILTADQKTQLEQRKLEMKQKREQFREKREGFRKNRTVKPTVAPTVKPIDG